MTAKIIKNNAKRKHERRAYFHKYYMKHREHYLKLDNLRNHKIRNGYKKFLKLRKQGLIPKGDLNNE